MVSTRGSNEPRVATNPTLVQPPQIAAPHFGWGDCPKSYSVVRLRAIECALPLDSFRKSTGRTEMLGLARGIKLVAVGLIAAAMFAGASTASRAETGSVRLHIVKAGFIVGVGGGSGTLIFHGKRYRLSIGGIGIGSLGVAAVDLVGTASNLRTASDIAGTYGAAGAGATFVVGGQAATLQNGRGVVLNVQGVQAGFQVSLGLAGMTIALQ